MAKPKKPPNAHEEWIRIQRRLYRENRAKILAAEVAPPLYKQYETTYNAATSRYREESDFKSLVAECRQRDIIYVGDYHTLPQSQKTYLKLLRALKPRKDKQPVLALEFVQGRYQDALDRFQRGRISERTFLRRIDYANQWPYDIWENYRDIFQFAKDRGYPVLAIECNQDECNTLHGRDSYAAWRIAETFHRNPSAQIITLIGELHIAPMHLPATVDSNLAKIGEERSHALVYQNCEQIYWKLIKAERDEVETVQIDDEAWCVINTPPVVRQQSYLNWLEYDSESVDYPNLERNFRSYLRAIARFLRLQPSQKVESVKVYGPGDTSFLYALKRSEAHKSQTLEEVAARIAKEETVFLTADNSVYLGKLSTNHAGEMAGRVLKHLASGWSATPDTGIYAKILDEAVAFFASKVLNHKRKCAHERVYQETLRRVRNDELDETSPEALVASLVLTHRRWERGAVCGGFSSWYEQDEEIQKATVVALGSILGEKLYYALTRNKVSRTEVRELFHQQLAHESEAAATYFHWIARVGSTRIPKRL